MTVIDAPRENLTPERIAELGRDVEPGTRLRLPGVLLPEEWRAIQAIKNSAFFLISNRGETTGERINCERCCPTNGYRATAGFVFAMPIYHEYLTVGCVPAPFAGLQDGLITYFSLNRESEGDKRRALRLELAKGIPELADLHPRTAATLRASADFGTNLYALVAGLAEPITRARAYELRDSIRTVMRLPANLAPYHRPRRTF